MKIWNADSDISDECIRVVRFDFETNLGPGTVTTMINKGVTIDQAKMQLLDEIIALELHYKKIDIVHYEILEILTDPDDKPEH
jgi:hypothetical protein